MAVDEQGLVAASETFLLRMDAIVGNIAEAATARVDRLRQAKKWIGLATGLVLLLELLFIFRPIGGFVRHQLARLGKERETQRQARAEAEATVRARECSIAELSALNLAIDRTAIFATTALSFT